MAALATVALADLGGSRDAAIDATGVAGRTFYGAPKLLVLAARVVTNSATVRLHRRDKILDRWVPSAVAAQVLDPGTDGGLYELRFNTASIEGDYALVQEAGTGTVTYVPRPGSN